ncbi:MAG: adenylyl-sulfate kinase [Sphingobacteriales bacterium]|nr:MAG: adenylyl-sulfate kinase [Sphingobacteriales bacterium]
MSQSSKSAVSQLTNQPDNQSTNLTPQEHPVGRSERNSMKGHRSFVIWFTGLSGSGKSTLAGLLDQELTASGIHSYILDGDNIRTGLNKDLDFTDAGRTENIRRIAEVARLMADAGIVVITAFISPFAKDRELARSLAGSEHFIEVFVNCPLEVCESRDVKGLYRKARAGQIPDFTGIHSPFEVPESPDLEVNTAAHPIDSCLEQVLRHIRPKLEL